MDWLKDDGIFLPMINDTGRNIFYKKCIDAVAKDKVICDIGTGTGFLSVLAVDAGAKKVITVEKDKARFEFAKSNFEKMGMLDKIEIIHDDFLNTDIDADYFVSETIGNWIFDENILGISEHCNKKKGQFIPDRFELQVVVYDIHPIFDCVQTESDAHEFQPDIEINKQFAEIINSNFKKQYPKQRHKSNMICNFFQQYKKMTDLKLNEIYKSNVVTVHLNNKTYKSNYTSQPNNIKISLPKGIAEKEAQVCLFWKAKFQNNEMDILDTIWCVPSKFIHNMNQDIFLYFDKVENCWMFEYD